MLLNINTKILELTNQYTLFGIILFTDAHPNVIRTLRDVLYYRALDDLSGSELAIFVTMLFPQVDEPKVLTTGSYQRMIPLKEEPKANQELFGWFGIHDRQELPIFIVFGFEQLALYYARYRIDDTCVDSVFRSLRKSINIIVREIKQQGVSSKSRVIDRKKTLRKLQWKATLLRGSSGILGLLDTIAKLRGAFGV